jgi:protein gp37
MNDSQEIANYGADERLALLETKIRNGLRKFYEVGNALAEINRDRLYQVLGFPTFDAYCRKRWNMSRTHAYRMMDAAIVDQNLSPMGDNAPKNERQARELVALPPEQQREIAATINFTTATAGEIRVKVEELKIRQPERETRKRYTVQRWNAMCIDERLAALSLRDPKARFNRQDDEHIGWAQFSINPVRGCELGCFYCYARDIANRFYPEGFDPVFIPELLSAAANTPVPKEAECDIGYRNVFVVSMGDLFGPWVPTEWIEAVLKMTRENSQWNFLFLTKVPQHLAEFDFPDNAWVGTSVDNQGRVRSAEQAMAKVRAGKRWVSIEPMETRIEMDFSMFDWAVIGGGSKSTKTPEWIPPHLWVYETTIKARAAGCAVYHKTNLHLAEPLHEFPGVMTVERQLPPEFGLVQLTGSSRP